MEQRKRRRVALVAAVVVVAAVLAGLYVFGELGGTGSVEVMVHDAPCSGCSHVYVTFSSVSVHEADIHGSGWTTLNVSGSTIDLEALNGTAMAKVLGLDQLSAGQYTQVRLAVTHVAVVFTNGSNVTAMLTSANSADVNVAFTVHPGMTTVLDIDVNLAASVHVTGGVVMFTPNIGSVVVSGS